LPASTWPLSQAGRAACVPLAEELRPHSPTRIITSTETKAQQTGQIVADILGLPLNIADGLQEHDRTHVTGLDEATFKANVARLLIEPDQLVFGLETGTQVRQRFTRALQTALYQYPTDTLAIVTHGTALTLFLTTHNPINPLSFWLNLRLPCFFLLDPVSWQLY
jgi:broad specificity phosphatase PhoE